MLRATIVLVVVAMTVCACGAPLPTEKTAEDMFIRHLQKKLGYEPGVFRLASFRKTNGVEANVFGVKAYSLNFVAAIEWPHGVNERCFGVGVQDDLWRECVFKNVRRLPGDIEAFRGTLHFEKYEKGWTYIPGMSKLESVETDETRTMAERRAKVESSRRREREVLGDAKRKLKRLDSRVSSGNAVDLNALAWFRATTPVESMQDGKAAIRLASVAVAKNPTNWMFLDTLAAAYARTGDFVNAMRVQRQSLELLEKRDKRWASSAPVQRAQERLRLYESKQPYTEKPRHGR